MRRFFPWLCCAMFVASGASPASAGEPAVKALHFGKLVDGKGKVLKDAIVVVRGDRIADVTTDTSKIPAGAEMIDLRRYTAVPGLIDVHTHLTFYWDQTSKVHPFDQLGSTRLPRPRPPAPPPPPRRVFAPPKGTPPPHTRSRCHHGSRSGCERLGRHCH